MTETISIPNQEYNHECTGTIQTYHLRIQDLVNKAVIKHKTIGNLVQGRNTQLSKSCLHCTNHKVHQFNIKQQHY